MTELFYIIGINVLQRLAFTMMDIIASYSVELRLMLIPANEFTGLLHSVRYNMITY